MHSNYHTLFFPQHIFNVFVIISEQYIKITQNNGYLVFHWSIQENQKDGMTKNSSFVKYIKDKFFTCDVSQHFLHVSILVPELISPGKNCNGSIPYISGMVQLSGSIKLNHMRNREPQIKVYRFTTLSHLLNLNCIPHLHFCIFEPHCYVSVIHIQTSLKNWTCPEKRIPNQNIIRHL